jgi:MFS family permease
MNRQIRGESLPLGYPVWLLRLPILSMVIAKIRNSLVEGYNLMNLTAYLLCVFFSIAFFVFLSGSQGFVLTNIGIPKESLGDKTAILSGSGEVMVLLMGPVVGVLSDLFGRRNVYTAGFLLLATGIVLYPVAVTFEQLVLIRLVFGIGASAVSTLLTAVVADIVYEKYRGSLSGIAGLFSGLGAVFSAFLLLPLPTKWGVKSTFYTVAGMAVFAGIVAFFGLKSTTAFKETDENKLLQSIEQPDEPSDTDGNPRNFAKLVKEAFGTLKKAFLVKDKKVRLGFATSFFARSDSVAITVFVPLWVIVYYLSLPDAPKIDPKSDDIKDSYRDAYVRASILSGVTQVFALICAPLFGLLLDKLDKALCVFFAAVMAGTGYLLLAFADPTLGVTFTVRFQDGN